MVQPPLGLVELGRGSGPVLVMGLEPDGPFARVLAGQQPGQLGGPDVRRFSRDGHVCLGDGDVSESICGRVGAARAGCHQSDGAIAPAVQVWSLHLERRCCRPCSSISWHSWHCSASFPSGMSILSLSHSQVRSRISSARLNSRSRLASDPQCSVSRSSSSFGQTFSQRRSCVAPFA